MHWRGIGQKMWHLQSWGATKDAYEFREGTCLKGYFKANSVNF